MSKKTGLILSIIALALGALGILSFIVLSFSDAGMSKYIPALILSIVLVVLNIIRIVQYTRKHEGSNEKDR